ncbi:hypothetical protein AQB9606_02670 [Aquabacterium sp. CECT 9606]|nr:hypothetical protein AQB9606_02670 [Aquabacterium sp. CECT 9606]
MGNNASTRIKRYQEFKKYLGESSQLFESLKNKNEKAIRLANLYHLCITPGGSLGGSDDRVFEIFYGQRPFDTQRPDPFNRQKITVLSEYGARLHYHLLDNGLVLAVLHPAKTENFSPTETSILISGFIPPEKLIKIVHSHFKLLNSYMQCTSLDGEPNLIDKSRIFWLRFTNHLIIDSKKQPIKAISYASEVLKYALTVGLSGFLLAAITAHYTDTVDYTTQADAISRKISSIDAQISSESKNIVDIKNALENLSKKKTKK